MTAEPELLPGTDLTGDYVVVAHGDVAEVYTGQPISLTSVRDVDHLVATAGAEVILAIPFAQARENGCRVSEHEQDELAGLRVDTHRTVPLATLLERLPHGPVGAVPGAFDVDDAAFAAQVSAAQAEIGAGAGSNFVLHRNYVSQTDLAPSSAALRLFRLLLRREVGAFWVFVARIGDLVLVGASPEKQVSRDSAGRVEMNPISGTLRVGQGDEREELVERFLRDTKERDELYMVVDEELKMMAQICHDVPLVHGPYLRRLSRVVHTEFTISGTSDLSAGEVLRRTFMAPTLTGSPLRNAFEVIDRTSDTRRGYYGGVLARVAHGTPRNVVDSCVIIRTARIHPSGQIVVGAGATVVRDSVPEAECAETTAKIELIRSLLEQESVL